MRKLLTGIIDFHDNKLDAYRDRFAELAAAQHPNELFIACCDSRVEVDLFCEAEPGELFELRNIGNMVPRWTGGSTPGSAGAAVEYAVLVLGIKDIVVLGHSECGAMKAIAADHPLPEGADSLAIWLAHGRETHDRLPDDGLANKHMPSYDQLSQLNVLVQLEHLANYPSVKSGLDAGTIRLHGLWFNVATAEVSGYDEDDHAFKRLDPEFVERIVSR